MSNNEMKKVLTTEYKLGFETLVRSDTFPKGLNKTTIKAISEKKGEPLTGFVILG